MSASRGGYVSGLDYIYDFQPEMGPLRVRSAMVHAGFVPPRIETACELGFGQGMSLNIHAAAQDVLWYGTDFNPAHAGFARDLATSSGAEVHVYDETFAEFCTRRDLPEFDLIALHGVWSWVSDDNRAVIADFLRRKLKVGGVVLLSYNVQPGFAALMPLHPLLIGHADAMGRRGESLAARIDAALGFAERVLAASPAYAADHPRTPDVLRSIRRQDRRYLAHEYFNASWTPSSFLHVAEALSAAKLEYACSPSLQQTPEALELVAEQRTLLAEIPDASYREVVRDLMANRSFRADYWVKGARRLSALERIERLLEQRVILMRQPGDVLTSFASALASSAMLEPVVATVVEALADHRPRSLAEIEDAVETRGVDLSRLLEAVAVLSSLGAVAPVQEETAVPAARVRTERLNAFLCAQAVRGADVRALASPVTGSGFEEVGGRIALIFVHGIARGLREPRDLGAQAQHVFRSLGIGVFRDGRPVESEEESLGILTAQARYFVDTQLPVLRAMQIAG
jgi:SAM-dependent methyltransferase